MRKPSREIGFDRKLRLPFDHIRNLALARAMSRPNRAIVFRWLAIFALVTGVITIDPGLPDAGGAATSSTRFVGIGAALADDAMAAGADGQFRPGGATWRVLVSEGDAVFRPLNGDWMALSQGTEISPAAQVKVGRDGRIVLSRDGDQIAMSPGAVIELEERTPDRSAVRVRQVSGSVRYELDRGPAAEPDHFLARVVRALFLTKQPDSRFEVDTPHLIAGVKGTRFGVSVTRDDTRVSVSTGVVSVRSQQNRTGVDVFAKQTAMVSTNQANVHVTGESGAIASPVDGGDDEASGDGASYRLAIFIVIALAFIITAAIALAAVIVAAARWAVGAISNRSPPRERGVQAGDDR